MLIINRFNFTGDLVIPKDRDRFIKKWSSGGSDFAVINFGIKAGSSVKYVELFGFKKEKIMLRTRDGFKEFAWGERNETDVKDSIDSMNKYISSLNAQEREFITAYDFIIYLSEILPEYKERVRVVGELRKEAYVKDGVGKYIDKFILQNIYTVDESYKSALTVQYEIFYNKDSIVNELNTDNKLYIDGYISQYISSSAPYAQYLTCNENTGKGQIMYLPQQFVLNTNKIDKSNETMMKQVQYLLKSINQANTTRKMYSMMWICSIVYGAEEVDFDESQLTKDQLLQIELGLSTINDFKPKGNIYGNRVDEVRLVKPVLRNDYIDGVIEVCSTSEFEEKVARFVTTDSIDSFIKDDKKSEKKKIETEVSDGIALEDIFG